MISVEYAIALAITVVAFSALGNAVAPAIDAYRSVLIEENREARDLIQQLEAMCPAPVQVSQ